MGLHIDEPKGDPTERDILNLATDLIAIPTREDGALRHLEISITVLEGWNILANNLAQLDQAITKERFPRLEVFYLELTILTEYDNELQTMEECYQEKEDNERKCRAIFRQVGNMYGVEFKCDVFMGPNIEIFRG